MVMKMAGFLEAVAAVAFAVVFVAMLIVLPQLAETVREEMAFTSAKVVARDIANIITISRASPGDTMVSYRPMAGKCVNFNARVSNCKVTVEKLSEEGDVIETDSRATFADFESSVGPWCKLSIKKEMVGEDYVFSMETIE